MGLRFWLPETGVTDPVGTLPAMLLTASTIKDSPENVRFFVAANLASGVDHMFVFLDAPARARAAGGRRSPGRPSARHLHPDRRKKTWWSDERPASLNVRQRINANWTRTLLEPFPWAEWLFHVDGDEVALRRPRRRSPRSRPSSDAVRLVPWEAVSEWTQPGASHPVQAAPRGSPT